MTDDHAAELVNDLEIAFPFPMATTARAELYVQRLMPLPYDPARIAIDALIERQESDRFPSIGTLFGAIRAEMARTQAAAQSRDDAVMLMYRIYDADLDDYRELDPPVPWTRALQDQSNAALVLSYRRELDAKMKEPLTT